MLLLLTWRNGKTGGGDQTIFMSLPPNVNPLFLANEKMKIIIKGK